MRIRFEEYPKWLSSELDKLVRPTTGKGQKLVDESSRVLDEGGDFFENLSRKGDKDMAGKKDPVSYKAARLVGHSAREASEILSRIERPHEVTWESLKAFKDQLSSLSKSLREIRTKTVSQLSGFYLLDMRSFGGVNDRILKQSERLTHFLEGDGNTLQKARTLTASVTEAETVRTEMSERLQEQGELAREKETVQNDKSSLESRLDQVEGDSSVKELLSIEKSLRNQSRQFKTEQLAHLKRPLRRLHELSVRGEVPMGTDAREALKSYIELPYRSFLSERSGSFFLPIVESLRAATTSGKLGLKPRKASRVLAQLKELTSSDVILMMQTEGRRLLMRRKALFQDPSCRSLYESRKQLMGQIADKKNSLEEISLREQALDTKSKALKTRFEEIVTLLETKTKQYTGQDVQVENLN